MFGAVLSSVATLSTVITPVNFNPLPDPVISGAPSEPIHLAQVSQLPAIVANAVIQTHSINLNQPTNRYRIANAVAQNWPDGCLGLAETGEFCAQVIVPGWQVVVTDGQQNWIYRTDNSAAAIRFETTAAAPSYPVQPPTVSPPPQSIPQQIPQQIPQTQPSNPASQDWAVQLRWSRIEDPQEPGLVFQLDVQNKPITQYANVVYQFYVRQSRGARWEHLYTNLGARLVPDASTPHTLPLELLRFSDLEETLGANYRWKDAQIRASILIRYDLSKAPSDRDLRLRFQHEENYSDISMLTYDDLIINADGSVEVPTQSNTIPAPQVPAATPTFPGQSFPGVYPPGTYPQNQLPQTPYPGGSPYFPSGLPPLPDTLQVPSIPPLGS